MGNRLGGRLAVMVATITAGILGLIAAPAAAGGGLQMYSATVSSTQFEQLRAEGYDVVNPQPTADGVALDLVLSPSEHAALAGKGIGLEVFRDAGGRSARQLAARQAAGGYNVWRDYDGADGLRAWMSDFVRENRSIADLEVIGQTLQGRDIVAIRLTRERSGHRGGSRAVSERQIAGREAVLYQGATHAREWIGTEVTRRLMSWFASQPRLLAERQLWFIPVVNPDGYQYTFDSERLWRKNLRDNDGDGQITNLDGVDVNRNYPDQWNYDGEGSSSLTSSDTYRGTGPASEPETQANMAIFDRVDFKAAVSYHAYGSLILYPLGWQVQTPVPDDPSYIALSGTDENPAIEGFDPDLSAELYTTNGEMTDWAAGSRDALSWTIELNEGCDGCGFVFPDDEAAVEREFEINQGFALDLARSAPDLATPRSRTGIRTEPFYLETVSLDPTRANNPASDLRFQYSYGDPQPVEVLARRSLRRVSVHYRINGGAEQTAPTSEFQGGERYGGSYDTYYRLMRGQVTGTDPGDEVEVWFEADRGWRRHGKGRRRGGAGHGARSDSFTYEAVSESGASTLVVAAEDYTGISPAQPGGPSYLGYYADALAANGISADVYDVDARGRAAPDALGVLGHYEAVIWYTGDDVITRDSGQVPGTASRLANDEMLEMRAYVNEGGNLLYTGKYAGLQYAANAYLFDPVANAPCAAGDDAVTARCLPLTDDFQQYYLGAYLYNDGAGLDENGDPFAIDGLSAPFDGLGWTLNGGDGASNQDNASSFLTTSSLLPEDDYPQFASDAPAEWDDGVGGVFEPADGSRYLYSQRADQSYKRLTRTIDLSGVTAADAPTLRFKASYDIEAGWDQLIIEAHTPGQDDWTTLPDASNTTEDTGDSCAAGWVDDLHPFLAHYQTLNADGTCSPTGTAGSPPGEWNSASGRSDGWEQWEIDLSDYAGGQVEVSIAYVSDWSFQGAGAFLDDVEVTPSGEGTTSFEDDADPLDGWTVAGAPEGTETNPNSWERTGSVGFEEGSIVSTADSLFLGFGFEGITSAAERNEVMDRSIGYLTGSP